MDLKRQLLDTIQNSLIRESVSGCGNWAEKYRVMGEPYPGLWTFKWHPWLREMHDAEGELKVGQKAAQLGYTELGLNKTFYCMDILKLNTLYILPAKTPDATDFSASRFDPSLELSPYLQALFSDVKNTGHKRAGAVNLYIRGSRSRSGLKSIPVSLLILDEVDEMTQDNIPLATERQSGQTHKETWMLSTPTIDDFGINNYFQQSTQEEFFFICPHCSRHINLDFPESLDIEGDDPLFAKGFLKCKECDHRLDHEAKSEWLKDAYWEKTVQNSIRGFHISQLYSSTVSPNEIARSALHSETSTAVEQELFNSKLGLPHKVKGAGVEDEDIKACIRGHRNKSQSVNGLVTVGVDVGRWLHYVVQEWSLTKNVDIHAGAICKTLEIGRVSSFEELDTMMLNFRPHQCVIDANPERRKAYEFANRFWGFVRLCFYGNNVNGKTIHEGKDDMEHMVTVDRTSWLDLSLGRFKNHSISLPLDTPLEFKEHIKALIRVPGVDSDGNPTAKYVNSKADHYAHANNYSEIALPFAVGMGQAQNITSAV